jgi:hypothetical protein
MTESRIILKRKFLKKANEAVKIIEVNPVAGLTALNECVSLIKGIYESFEEEATK